MSSRSAPLATPVPCEASTDPDRERTHFTTRLENRPFLEQADPCFWHGRLYRHPLESPRVTWRSMEKPRDDHDAPTWLTASEFEDTPNAMSAKLSHLATLLRLSKNTVVYSGAGISRAAGIGQAARGAGGGGNKSTTALPTYTHYALSALAQQGLIHGWVQQNHDGLPQKAGFPQECVNEIHGSWYDPSNPVVLYSGSLKSNEYSWMRRAARKADLVLVLGTSLGGLNSDQVATVPAERSLKGKSLGMVLINLQQTNHDGEASLRIFGSSDSVFRALLSEMRIPEPVQRPAVFSGERMVLVPYNKDGERTGKRKMWLDLRPGAKIRLNPSHNIQGAEQPAYLHIGSDGRGPGAGVVTRWSDRTVGIDLKIEGAHMLLGQWWLEAAERGGPVSIPVVNASPIYEDASYN